MIRYGIIGTGMMGREHIRNLALLEGACVTAIADPHPASREQACALIAPDAAVYADYRSLLASAAVDAVVIATPNHTHAAVLDDAFAFGRHLLVEKPLATTVDDARRIAARAAHHPGVVQVGLEYRYAAHVQRLRAALQAGTVGHVRMVSIREHRNPFLEKVGDWNRFSRNTGGTMVEKCCHFFDLMRLLSGAEPVAVYASGGADVNHRDERYAGETPDILDNAFAVVELTGGLRGALDLCMFAEASLNHQDVTVTGDAGKLQALAPQLTVTIGRREPYGVERVRVEADPQALAAGAHYAATYGEHLAFARAIEASAAPEVGVRDGVVSVAMGVAAERSIALGRLVTMDEVLPEH